MIRNPLALQNKSFDLLIIGGGIVGAGIAWDASLRGFSSALVEQGDFASGTSSNTTKLIHGGLRYLENFDFRLVQQAIQERRNLLRQAPSLVQPLQFLIPIQGFSPRPWPIVWFGVFLYDILAGKTSLQKHQFLNRREIIMAEPVLTGAPISRGAIYADAQMDDARLVLQTIQSAALAGASVVNYCRVKKFLLDGERLIGVEVEDKLKRQSFSIQATCIVNATGPWVDRVRQLADPPAKPMVRPSKGIHLVYPNMGLRHALLLSSPKDRRIFFLIPWRDLTLIGTTDTDYSGDPGEVRAESSDVQYLIDETNRLLPRLRLERSKIIATFAGVRPLVLQEKKDPWAVSRMHLIHEDPNGLLSLIGGKYTTFRKIAQDVVDRCVKRFPDKKLAPCQTMNSPLVSATRDHRIAQWIQQDPRLKETLCLHHAVTKAEVRFAIEEEMAATLSDLFFRRLGIAWSICRGLDALDKGAAWMGEYMGWSDTEVQHQKQCYQEEMTAARSALT